MKPIIAVRCFLHFRAAGVVALGLMATACDLGADQTTNVAAEAALRLGDGKEPGKNDPCAEAFLDEYTEADYVHSYTDGTFLGVYKQSQLVALGASANGLRANFKLCDDLGLVGTLVPLGKGLGLPYEGVFDFNKKAIRGLRVAETTPSAALFYQTRGATLRDLWLVDAQIGEPSIPATHVDYAAALVAQAYGTIIDNVHVQVRIYGQQFVGGVIGVDQQGVLRHISVGYGDTLANDTHVIAGGYVGGLVGWSADSTFDHVANAYANAYAVTAGGACVGGVVGFAQNPSIAWSKNLGGALLQGGGTTHAGGLIGCARGGAIHDSYAQNWTVGNVGARYVGGIAGIAYDLTLDRTYTSGSLQGELATTGRGFGRYVVSAANPAALTHNSYSFAEIGWSQDGGYIGELAGYATSYVDPTTFIWAAPATPTQNQWATPIGDLFALDAAVSEESWPSGVGQWVDYGDLYLDIPSAGYQP